VRESVQKNVKSVNGKSVEETVITTKFFEDGSKEVREVVKDEQGTREKTTRYDAKQQLENKGENKTESSPQE